MSPMARSLPKFRVVDVGRDHFLETAFPVLFLDEINKSIIYMSTPRLEKAGPRWKFVEEEQFLLLFVKNLLHN